MERRIVASVSAEERAPAEVARAFRRQVAEGALELRPAGEAREDPALLLRRGYAPRYTFALFDTRFYLADVRQNPDIRFFVAYVVRGRVAWPRIFYKDVSLVWRSASHLVRSEEGTWIGKGDLETALVDGEELAFSNEATTDLPLEMQTALERLIGRATRIPTDHRALDLVLRRGGPNRVAPFSDFTAPRRRDQANPAHLVNGGRKVARFTRPGDPASLRFARGYEPDFRDGVIERSESRSRVYGGRLRRFRILSRNRRIQYLFFAGRRQAWLVPPQTLTTRLSPYGLRTIDVAVDEDLCVPGWEYHFLDESEDPPRWVSQIPEGYAGRPNPDEPSRCDASPWLDRLPVIREFRRRLL